MGLTQKLINFGLLIIVLTLIGGFWGFWKLVTQSIESNINLGKETDMRKAWEKAPIAVDFNVFIFNITNPWEVHNGSAPVVQEVGPFAFFEWKEKANIVDHKDNDTVSFNMKTTWYFNPAGSGGLTLDEVVVVPHMVLVNLVYMVELRKPASLRVVNNALADMFDSPQTAFVTTSVRDLLFDGIPINCTSTQFAPAAICTALRAQAAALHRISDDEFAFSLFGVKNGTPDAGRFNVKRGTMDYREVGKVMLYNHEPQQYVWDGAECNKLSGTDSTIFPPLQDRQNDIVSFSPDLCRSLAATYVQDLEYQGVPAAMYTATLGDMSANPAEKCFCPSPETCLKRGAIDLTECADSPIIVTLPHMYDADPSYRQNVTGLSPDKEKHQIFLIFEPITGSPLSARKRLQFNIHLHAVKKVKIMANLPDCYLPVFWVEESVDLNSTYTDMLLDNLFRPLSMVTRGRWFLLVLGVVLVIIGLVLRQVQKNTVQEVNLQPRPATKNNARVTDVTSASSRKF